MIGHSHHAIRIHAHASALRIAKPLGLIAVLTLHLATGCRDQSEAPQKKADEQQTPTTPSNGASPKQPSAPVEQAAATPAQPSKSAKNSSPPSATRQAAKSHADPAGGGSPGEAHKRAIQFQEKATKAAKQGNMEAAYSLALSGWEKVRQHEADVKCRRLAADLLRQLEAYGEHISADSTEFSIGGKPLRYE